MRRMSKMIKIVIEKIMVRGVPCMKICEIDGVLGMEDLPMAYWGLEGDTIKPVDGGSIKVESSMLITHDVESCDVNNGKSHYYSRSAYLKVGWVYPASTWEDILCAMIRAVKTLACIRAEEKALGWNGIERIYL